jgi:hypothetical protein
VLPGVDQRSAIARRYRDVIGAIISDLGGLERVTEIKLHLIRKFASLVVQTETMESDLARGQQINVMRFCKMSSTMIRLGSRIGIKRYDSKSWLDDEEQQDQDDEPDDDDVIDLDPVPDAPPPPPPPARKAPPQQPPAAQSVAPGADDD